MIQNNSATTRRNFFKTAGSAVAAATAAPLFLHATDKSGGKTPVVGVGAYKYECHHNWGEVPDHVEWGDTHGVTVDAEGLIYVKHRKRSPKRMDAIVVFDPQGKYVRSFGKEYHGAGHGIDLRKEGGEEFLYLSCIQMGIVVKTNLKGEQVWRIGRPTKPEHYKKKNARYSPTNLAFAPDGGIYVGDGYGSHFIHQYDRNNNLVRTFGGVGKGKGRLRTPHGIWLDDRPGRVGPGASGYWKKAVARYGKADGAPLQQSLTEPTLVVADRANARLQYFSLDGKHLGYVNEVSFPADIDIQDDVMLVPDLHARITLFDANNKVITHLGYDAEWTKKVLSGGKLTLRRDPKKFRPGRFVHPHDACFDARGNIIVAEWVPQGRVSFLRKVD
ncbi:MAG: peptidase [Planctomycetaceae bacterium]